MGKWLGLVWGARPIIWSKSGFLTPLNTFQGLRRVTIGRLRGNLVKQRVRVGFSRGFLEVLGEKGEI